MAIRAADLEVRVTADTSQAQGELNNFQGMLAGVLVGGKIQNLGEGMLDFVTDFVSVGATFEEQMTVVDQIIGGTISHIDELKKAAIDADIKTMFNAQEVAEGMEMIARAGFGAQQIIGTPGKSDGLIHSVLYFAAATKTNVAEAGQTFSAAARIFEGSGLGMIEIADLLTAAILRSGKSSADFMTAFQYVGTISQQWGTAPDEIATAIALLSQLGIRSRSVGTGLRSMYSAFGAKGDEIASLGIDLYDVDTAGNQVLKTLPDIINQFNQYLSTLDQAGKSKVMEDLFGKPASSPLLTLFTTGADNWDRIVQDMDNVGSAQEMMEARMNTLRGSLEILSATWLGFKKVLGDSVSDYIKPVVDALAQLVNWLQNLPESALKVIALFIAFTAVLVTLTGAIIVFTALLGPVGGVAGVLAVVGATALPLIAIFAGIGLGIAALKTNFGGVTDFFTGLSDKWDDFKERYEEGMDGEDIHNNEMGDGPLGKADPNRAKGFYNVAINALAAIRDMGGPDGLGMFKTLWPHMQEVAQGFGVIGRSVGRLSNVIKKHGLVEGLKQLFTGDIGADMLKGLGDIVSEGPRMIGRFFRSLNVDNKKLEGIFDNMGSAFLLLGTAIEAAFDGNWDKARDAIDRMFDRIKKALEIAVPAALDIGIIVLSATFDLISNVTGSIWEWIKGKILGTHTVVEGPGAGAHQEANGGAIDVGLVLLDAAVDLAGELWQVTNQFGAWLFGKIMTGAAAAVDLGRVFIDAAPELWGEAKAIAENTAGWLKTKLKSGLDEAIDLGRVVVTFVADLATTEAGGEEGGGQTVAGKIGESIVNGLKSIGTLGADLVGAIWDAVVGVDWGSLTGEKSFAAGETMGAAIRNLIIAGVSKLAGMLTVDNVKGIFTTLASLAYAGATGVPTAMKLLVSAVTNFVAGAIKGLIFGEGDIDWTGAVTSMVNTFIGALDTASASIITAVSEFFGGGTTTLFKGSFGGGKEIKTPGVFDSLVDALKLPKIDTPTLPDWLSNFSWFTGPIGILTDAINLAIRPLKAAWDLYKSIHDLFSGEEAKDDRDRIADESGGLVQPTVDENGNGIPDNLESGGFLPRKSLNIPKLNIGNGGGAMADAGAGLMAIAKSAYQAPFTDQVNSDLSDAGRNLSTFASRIPTHLNSMTPGLVSVAQRSMSQFNSALGAGFAVAATIAAFGARATAIAAQMPSMYSHGYNVGLSLGQGMAAGIRAAIGDVIAARNALRYAGTGESDRSQPFSAPAPSSSGQVPTKTPQLIYQTNNVNIDPKNVGEFFETAGFVSNLDRDRQIVLGRA